MQESLHIRNVPDWNTNMARFAHSYYISVGKLTKIACVLNQYSVHNRRDNQDWIAVHLKYFAEDISFMFHWRWLASYVMHQVVK